ncbi:MAG: TIGR04255 family protein [Acidimicrobiia bacterium]
MGSNMGIVIDHPFGPPVPEIPLTRAPLVLVVAQARFPTVASITEGETFIAPFQERLRAEYPVLRHEQQTQLLLGPEGPIQQNTGRIWKFTQAKGPWSVALAPDFLALSTSTYTSHADFFDRFEVAMRALEGWLTPPICDRLGVRYVDRVDDPALLGKLHGLLRPEILGVSGVKTGDNNVTERHSLSDATFAHTDGTETHARWGSLPEHATFDPTFAPSDKPSWVLDIDTYTTSPKDFAVADLTAQARLFADRTYRFFRWAVTDAFLDAHGAQ